MSIHRTPSLSTTLSPKSDPSDDHHSIDLHDIFRPAEISHEYRSRLQASKVGQWYFDEYSGLYRHKAPDEALEQRPLETHQKLIRKSTLGSQTPPIFSSAYQVSSPWATPASNEQVYSMCEQANATGNPNVILSLCNHLMYSASQCPAKDQPRKNKENCLSNTMVLESQRILKKLAMVGQERGKSGNSEAQFILANCFGMGALGIPINHERAFLWYIQASKQSHAEATYRVGVCYELGIGTRRDEARAMAFYRKAAVMSNIRSMYKLGIILLQGLCDQTPSPREAMAWLQRAASAASPECPHALYTLAMIQITGEYNDTGIITDQAYGLELLHKAANLGHAVSQVRLGEMYEHGDLVKEDPAQSIYWHSLAAEQGNPEGALALSAWYLTGSKDVLEQSDRQAYLWARKAATLSTRDRWSMAKACYVIGYYCERGIGLDSPVPKDAKKWFGRAVQLGHMEAKKRVESQEESTILVSNQDSV
ncbi:hypothetical protein CLU79DRAFT_762862 [Phycomyces nitens]|nr:hypothetical protein CLU79DRAFT_762862 [Phycomyces nitens]